MHDHSAALIVAQLLFLEAENPEKPISLYINSPGGSVTAGMAIYDTVRKNFFTCEGSSVASVELKSNLQYLAF